MRFAKLVVIVAMATMAAQVECVAACAADMCGGGFGQTDTMPPCHRGHNHSHDPAPSRCAHGSLIPAAALPQTPHFDAPVFPAAGAIAAVNPAPLLRVSAAELTVLASSPPEAKPPLPLVLRI